MTKASNGGRWSRTRGYSNRGIVLIGPILATLVALLLQQLLGLGVRKAQQQLRLLRAGHYIVELGQDALGNLTGLEAMWFGVQFKNKNRDLGSGHHSLTEQTPLPCSWRSPRLD